MFEVLNSITTTYLPEVIVIIFIFINLLGSMFFNRHLYNLSKWITLLGIVLAIASTFCLQIEPEVYSFGGMFLTNIYTSFFKIFVLISSFFLLLLSRNMIRDKRDRAFEYCAVFLSGILFAMCSISSVNFLTLFVSLEAMSICCYLLMTFVKRVQSQREIWGYLVQNIVVSFLYLIGLSILIGLCGCLNYADITNCLSTINANSSELLLTLSLMFIMCSLFCKLGLAPFSGWVANVFSNISNPICAYISLIPVLVGFSVLSRLLMCFLPYTVMLKIVLALVAVITIFYSACSSVRQECMKRLMAYSMSVHSGVILLGLCVFSVYSLSSVLFYLLCYVVACIGAWSAITIVYNSAKSTDISVLKGLIYHRPYFVMAFTFILITLAGFAPTCGFVSKLYIFSAVARSGMFYLPFLLIALFGLVVMVYSYWRIIRGMFRRIETDIVIDTRVMSSKILLYASSIVTILVGLFSDKFVQFCQLVAYYM